MDYAERDWEWYFKELMSNGCLCGRTKSKGKSFCFRCYKALPQEMQRGLYLRIGEGYEEEFEAAVKYLEENLW